jgi:hypothetical protein
VCGENLDNESAISGIGLKSRRVSVSGRRRDRKSGFWQTATGTRFSDRLFRIVNAHKAGTRPHSPIAQIFHGPG